MSEWCAICGQRPHACVVSSHEARVDDRESPLARWAADSAITNSELGAQLTLRAILDLLERHGQHEAREIVEVFGAVSIAAVFASEAWREEIPTAGQAGPTTTTETKDNHHG